MKTFLERLAKPLQLLLILTAVALPGARAAEKPSDIADAPDGPSYSRETYQLGRSKALKDVSENRLIVEMSGMPKPWDGEWARLLLERYHIQLNEHGCLTDEKIAGYERGYNEVSLAEIKKRYGPDLLRDTQAEAEKQWNAKQKR